MRLLLSASRLAFDETCAAVMLTTQAAPSQQHHQQDAEAAQTPKSRLDDPIEEAV
jgi:hypothetical protein